MTPLLFIGVAVAGGAGAALRFVADGFLRSRAPARFPVSTTVINVSGSLALGFVTAAVLGGALPVESQLLLGTGLLGGYTTFSTASIETVRLLADRRLRAALGSAFGMLALAVVGAGIGYWLGSLL